jgi:hypothetical protein
LKVHESHPLITGFGKTDFGQTLFAYPQRTLKIAMNCASASQVAAMKMEACKRDLFP